MLDEPAPMLPRRFVTWVGLAGLSVVTLAVVIGRVTGAKSGTVADWVAALATLAGFMAAVVAAWYGANAFATEQRRESRWAEESRRAQASLVAAWATVVEPVNGVHWKPAAVIHLRNASEIPVLDVTANLVWEGTREGRHAALLLGTKRVAVLPPGSDAMQIIVEEPPEDAYDQVSWREPDWPSPSDEGDFSVDIEFLDSRGNVWTRLADGSLSWVVQVGFTPPSLSDRDASYRLWSDRKASLQPHRWGFRDD